MEIENRNLPPEDELRAQFDKLLHNKYGDGADAFLQIWHFSAYIDIPVLILGTEEEGFRMELNEIEDLIALLQDAKKIIKQWEYNKKGR